MATRLAIRPHQRLLRWTSSSGGSVKAFRRGALAGDFSCDEVVDDIAGMPLPRLTRMHNWCILMHMRTTLNIDDSLLNNAAKLTGVKEKTSLVRLGLEALIAKESARRLATLGGTEKRLRAIRRRRPRKNR